MAQVTIIIPNYNGKQLLENCIRTLERQTCQDFRLLIVDNGSTDGSTSLTSERLSMEWLCLHENTGFCYAVNAGIRRSDTPYVLLLNNDIEADEHFVEEMLNGIRKSEDIFSCSAQMLDFKDRGILDNAGDLYLLTGWAMARGKGRPAEAFDRECDVFSCCGGAAIYRVDMLKETGLLDERHFAYLEDVDLGYRAKICGWRNCYLPAAKVYHVGSATTGTRYNEKKVFLAARNTVFVIYKNMPPLQLLLNLPFILAGIVVKWLFFLKKGLAGQYCKGIFAGIRGCGECERVRFQKSRLSNYVRIEWELLVNVFRLLSGR